jgi:hypothetical protein
MKIRKSAAINAMSERNMTVTASPRGIPHLFIRDTGISTADARTTATKSAITMSLTYKSPAKMVIQTKHLRIVPDAIVILVSSFILVSYHKHPGSQRLPGCFENLNPY